MLYKSNLLTLETIGYIVMSIVLWAQEAVFTRVIVDWDRFIQVMYLGRAPRTKEILPDFLEKCRVTRHSRVFRGLTVVNGPSGFGASQLGIRA